MQLLLYQWFTAHCDIYETATKLRIIIYPEDGNFSVCQNVIKTMWRIPETQTVYKPILNWRSCSAEAASCRLPKQRPGFEPRWGVWFVVDEVALRQVFLRVLRFPLPIVILPTAPHSSSGDGTIGQIVSDVPSGVSLIPLQETRKKKKFCCPTVAGNSSVPEAFPNPSFYALWPSDQCPCLQIQRSGVDSRHYRFSEK
jgi:hypothetical protein